MWRTKRKQLKILARRELDDRVSKGSEFVIKVNVRPCRIVVRLEQPAVEQRVVVEGVDSYGVVRPDAVKDPVHDLLHRLVLDGLIVHHIEDCTDAADVDRRDRERCSL